MNNTTNTLLQLETEDLEQVLTARKTIENIARKASFTSRPHATQLVHRRSPNGSNGHNGHRPRKAKMSQDVRNRISASMRKLWQKRRKAAAKSEQTAPA